MFLTKKVPLRENYRVFKRVLQMVHFYLCKKFSCLVDDFKPNQFTGMSEITFDLELDCRGLNCPIPILKTKKAVDGLGSGQILKMLATDPGSVNDVQSWSKRTENQLLDHSEDGGVYSFLILKK
jgi:Predicted redox protein, regulator of disulfide bond formation